MHREDGLWEIVLFNSHWSSHFIYIRPSWSLINRFCGRSSSPLSISRLRIPPFHHHNYVDAMLSRLHLVINSIKINNSFFSRVQSAREREPSKCLYEYSFWLWQWRLVWSGLLLCHKNSLGDLNFQPVKGAPRTNERTNNREWGSIFDKYKEIV